MTVDECALWLAEHDDYLILSHQRPDGDTLCSGAALCSALRRTGKTAYCLDNPETTKTYADFVAPYTAAPGFRAAFVITVDVADEKLIPACAMQPVDLAIDHHPSNSGFAARLCLDARRSSCGELVLEVIRLLCGGITEEEANLLYVAVSTDTGCFCYLNTNAATLRAAAELLEMGADNKKLNTLLFRTMTMARITLEGMIYSSLRYFRDGSIVAAVVTLNMIEGSGASESDCEDLAGLPGKAEGSLLAITVRQIEPEKCKLSLRSKPSIDSSAICAVFGGGGHAMAAGCTIDQEPEKALELILGVAYEKWPEA